MTTPPQAMDHEVIGPVPAAPPAPLTERPDVPTLTAAEEARTLIATVGIGSLATLTEEGDPWASMVTYGPTADGSPVLYVSTLAEHGRNLARDQRASLVVVADSPSDDPLDSGRVTVAGRVRRAEEDEARDAHLAVWPSAALYAGFGDFTFWLLQVERVRWVGGYGRMDSVDAAGYAAARPDPVVVGGAGAIDHLNQDHADSLLLMARKLGGYPDATVARCARVDRYGIDLLLETPRGSTGTRVGFAAPVDEPAGLRAASVELVRRAEAAGSAA